MARDRLDHHAVPGGVQNKDLTRWMSPSKDSPKALQAELHQYDPTRDKKDMRRLGKKQEVKRRFRSFSLGGYAVILGLTWEFALTTGVLGLANGGTAGTIWMSLAVGVGMLTCTLSLSEAASMAPTSGGQYHWVSEFAPAEYQKSLSYAVGWMCAVGWQAGLPSSCYIGAQQVVALIDLCHPEYVHHNWHGALLMIAWAAAAVLLNTVLIGKLPLFEGLAVVLHTCGFFAVLVVIWVMGPRNSPRQVWTTFDDANHWRSQVLATFVGILGPLTTNLGADAAVHLAEELQDASKTLPRVMCWSAIINYLSGWLMTVTFMQNITDLEKILNSSTGQPWIGLILDITRSRVASIVVTIVMMVLYFSCSVNAVTTSSRQLWSFARDKGLPFHAFLAKVSANGVPTNSVLVTLGVTILFSFMVILSTTAFNIILGVSAVGLLSSYIIVVGVILLCRLTGGRFPESGWRLGVWGVPTNALALAFALFSWIFTFFPPAPDPSASTMNWNVLIFAVLVIGAMIYYSKTGRHEYEGPVQHVIKHGS